MPDRAPALTSETIPGIRGRGDGRAAFTTPSVRPQSPTGRHAPVSVKGAAGAYPAARLKHPPRNAVEIIIDRCWRRGCGIRETIKAVERNAQARVHPDQVQRRFALLANTYAKSPP